MGELLRFMAQGVPIGCVFGLMAMGLVLTYKTSAVFNLAFAAQAFLAGALFYNLRERHGWHLILALFVVVGLVGPLVGLGLDRFLFRHLRTASQTARLVTSLGLLVAGPKLVELWLLPGPAFNPSGVVGDLDWVGRWGDVAIDADQAATIGVSLAVAVVLTAVFRYSSIGLQMRAVAESARMSQLHGIDADRVSAISWMLSSMLASLAGVLLAPLFAQLVIDGYIILLIAAIAAAVFARLDSVAMAFVGGLILGIAQAVLAGWLPTNSVLAQGLRPSLPFVVLFVLLLVRPGLRRPAFSDPLAGVDPPPAAPVAMSRGRRLAWINRILGTLFCTGLVAWTVWVADDFWLLVLTLAAVSAVVMLSMTVLTGMGGMISLCQATFAGIGAFTTAQLTDRLGLDMLTALVIGALIAAAVGAMVAVPALRLGGLYLSLATLAFALMFENILVPQSWVGGDTSATQVPRPAIGPVDFGSDRAWFLLVIVILVLVALGVRQVQRGSTGLFLAALRGSTAATRSVGISPTRMKITAFALSAGIAGIGGGLLAATFERADREEFVWFWGLVWVVLVVTLGANSIQAAITAGLALRVFPELLEKAGVDPVWAFVLFGLGALTFARHPEGIIEYNTRRSVAFVRRHVPWLADGDPDASGREADDERDRTLSGVRS